MQMQFIEYILGFRKQIGFVFMIVHCIIEVTANPTMLWIFQNLLHYVEIENQKTMEAYVLLLMRHGINISDWII